MLELTAERLQPWPEPRWPGADPPTKPYGVIQKLETPGGQGPRAADTLPASYVSRIVAPLCQVSVPRGINRAASPASTISKAAHQFHVALGFVSKTARLGILRCPLLLLPPPDRRRQPRLRLLGKNSTLAERARRTLERRSRRD